MTPEYSDKIYLSRANSTNTTMAEKTSEKPDRYKTGGGDQSPANNNNKRKKKFSRAMSFDVKALAEALKHPISSDSSNMNNESAKSSPKQKKSYINNKHPSSSTSDIEEELQDQQFIIQYLGHVDVKNPGLEEIISTVNKMYNRSKPYLKSMGKSVLTLSRDGINIKQDGRLDVSKHGSTESADANTANDLFITYKPRRILYCGVDKHHQRVFSFNYQFGARAENIQLHVLVCKSKDDAKNVAKYLAQLFKKISTEMHRKEKEDKKQHQEGLTRSKTKSNTNINTYINLNYKQSGPVTSRGSKDGSCSPLGSGEWIVEKERERIELSMA